jgi:hypothetical protein
MRHNWSQTVFVNGDSSKKVTYKDPLSFAVAAKIVNSKKTTKGDDNSGGSGDPVNLANLKKSQFKDDTGRRRSMSDADALKKNSFENSEKESDSGTGTGILDDSAIPSKSHDSSRASVDVSRGLGTREEGKISYLSR